jgi:sterol desaturase/sphingolipid hydroxylase (fatty acid hydroxylase superfamily)
MGLQLVVLMVVFSFIESRWPSSPASKWWRRPVLVDLCGWSVHPLALAAGIALAVGSTEAVFSELPKNQLWLTFSVLRARVTAFPFWSQMAMAVIITDFLSYWIHRAYHRFPVLWAFHVVHHTSEELDWLSTSRLHPASQVLNTAVIAAALFLGGLPVSAVLGANLFIGAAALLVHANVRWTFGPLRHLLVSPLFHQWHHARIDDDADRQKAGNFGAAFSVWDRLFGTWSLPSTKRPVHFGVENAPAPTISGLLFHPLRACIRFFSNRLGASSAESKTSKGPRDGLLD